MKTVAEVKACFTDVMNYIEFLPPGSGHKPCHA